MSEKLTVIVRTQELLVYVLEATAKSPREYRFTFTNRMQNWTTDILEAVILANDVYINPQNFNLKRYELRRNYQHNALTKIKMLSFLAREAMERRVLTLAQYERISKLTKDCQFLIGGWIKSDKEQYKIKW